MKAHTQDEEYSKSSKVGAPGTGDGVLPVTIRILRRELLELAEPCKITSEVSDRPHESSCSEQARSNDQDWLVQFIVPSVVKHSTRRPHTTPPTTKATHELVTIHSSATNTCSATMAMAVPPQANPTTKSVARKSRYPRITVTIPTAIPAIAKTLPPKRTPSAEATRDFIESLAVIFAQDTRPMSCKVFTTIALPYLQGELAVDLDRSVRNASDISRRILMAL
ncbi:unnamed protein product [Phytophthora lilii]|uniref:Unnamed protein product n=1 Tax=Phytophthora lilii TaxID=2077276 RepID=A0A9W6X1P0_9STRA|nr:unnamed protein product [Phytophthora lilii]